MLHAEGIARMEELLAVHTPQYAVVDLKLKGEANGLACVRALHAHSPQMRIVVLTGFASIATAVEAIKLGAGITWPSRPTPTTSKPPLPCRKATPR